MSADVTPGAAPPEETTSLSEHEAQFSEGGDGTPAELPTKDDADASEPAASSRGSRHRAQSQKASPDDVKAIAEYTKRLREAEAETGITQKPGESQRVFELRRRAELAEARRDANKQPKTPPPPPTRPPTPPPPAAAKGFTDPEPTIDQFADRDDPYLALNRALAAWDRKKEAFEHRQQWEKAQGERAAKQHDEQFTKWITDRQAEHDTRLGQFITAHPDALSTMEAAADVQLTPIMYASIELHERGPEFMLALAQHRDLVDDLFLLTEGKPVHDPLNNPLVAIVQRRLLQRVQAAPTGSAAAPRQPPVAPRPPNPVRTVPQTPSDTLPGDDDSLAAHEKAWGSRRRSR